MDFVFHLVPFATLLGIYKDVQQYLIKTARLIYQLITRYELIFSNLEFSVILSGIVLLKLCFFFFFNLLHSSSSLMTYPCLVISFNDREYKFKDFKITLVLLMIMYC